MKNGEIFEESTKTEDDHEIALYQENEDLLKRIDSVTASDFLHKTNVISYWTIVIGISNVIHIFVIIRSYNLFRFEVELS